MVEVKIPFRQEFRDVMLSGEKTMTSRTKRYGNMGDTFKIFGVTFQLTKQPWKMYLGVVAYLFYTKEGLDSEDEFIAVWNEIHPRKGFDPEQQVWAHTFKRIE